MSPFCSTRPLLVWCLCAILVPVTLGSWSTRRGYLAQDTASTLTVSTHHTVRQNMGRTDCQDWCALVRDCKGMSWAREHGCVWWREVDWDKLDTRQGLWITSEYIATSEEVCHLAPILSEPLCFAPERLWTYEPLKGGCHRIYYQGCFGSKNLFNTKDECEGLCEGVSYRY